MDELTVAISGTRLVDELEPATTIAGRYFVDHQFAMIRSSARKDPGGSNWKITFTFAAHAPDITPGPVDHQLEFRLSGLTLDQTMARGLQFAAGYFAGADHVLVDTRACETTGGRFTTTFTFMGATD